MTTVFRDDPLMRSPSPTAPAGPSSSSTATQPWNPEVTTAFLQDIRDASATYTRTYDDLRRGTWAEAHAEEERIRRGITAYRHRGDYARYMIRGIAAGDAYFTLRELSPEELRKISREAPFGASSFIKYLEVLKQTCQFRSTDRLTIFSAVGQRWHQFYTCKETQQIRAREADLRHEMARLQARATRSTAGRLQLLSTELAHLAILLNIHRHVALQDSLDPGPQLHHAFNKLHRQHPVAAGLSFGQYKQHCHELGYRFDLPLHDGIHRVPASVHDDILNSMQALRLGDDKIAHFSTLKQQ